jgi:hypothetical protein
MTSRTIMMTEMMQMTKKSTSEPMEGYGESILRDGFQEESQRRSERVFKFRSNVNLLLTPHSYHMCNNRVHFNVSNGIVRASKA